MSGVADNSVQPPLFTFYGDDFTGSTDALEALTLGGVPTVLFLGLPDETQLAQFRHCRAVGIAGESRSKSPEWMSEQLPAIFGRLRQMGARVCQYKVCSTFDSSPETGNIGRALEIGQQVFGGKIVPIISSAPRLGRWVVFANLFARAHDAIYRIDRHPTMSRHPVTPMKDGDLRVHLASQTRRRIDSINFLELDQDGGGGSFAKLLREQEAAGVVFDALYDSHLRQISELVWRNNIPFVIGSSGFTSGMASLLSEQLRTAGSSAVSAAPDTSQVAAADRIIVLSGSGSPVTERQIRWALTEKFAGVRLEAEALVESSRSEQIRDAALQQALQDLQGGRSVVLYSALGPADCQATAFRDRLATEMGILLRDLVRRSGIRRVVIAGGDTSTHAGQQLGIHALTMISALAPGAPLCCAHSDDGAFAGLELVMKGGQVGQENFFSSVREGHV